MAGDSIKMEIATLDKPEVLAITAKMGWSDPDITLRKLFRLWCWFDHHTTDGNAAGVTTVLIDHIVSAPGFSKALAAYKWLEMTPNGIK